MRGEEASVGRSGGWQAVARFLDEARVRLVR
jgi:hypothetical protein